MSVEHKFTIVRNLRKFETEHMLYVNITIFFFFSNVIARNEIELTLYEIITLPIKSVIWLQKIQKK